MQDVATIAKVVELLRKAANPTRIILFGSQARAQAKADSDIDLLVVEPQVTDRLAEMVRLLRALSPLRLPIDLLVASEEMFRYWSDTPGNVYFEARVDGRVLYEAA